jgi:hypothetical protein
LRIGRQDPNAITIDRPAAWVFELEELPMRGDGNRNAGERLRMGKADLDVLDRETRWELVGCIVLLVIAVLMASAVNFYVP